MRQEASVTHRHNSSRGELLSVTLPGGTSVEYIHDPLGRRIAKKVNGVITEKYLWSGLTTLLAVYDGNDSLLMRFEYADARMPFAMKKSGVLYYLVYDQVGSLKLIAGSAGNVVKRLEYDTFGNIISDSNPNFAVPFGFAGGLHDRHTGLVRFGYRDYNPDTGRWTAKDPIGFAGWDTDLYGYCLSDPVNLVDPDGKSAMEIAVPVAVAVSQLDTALPGPADAIAGAILSAAWMYDNYPDEDDMPCGKKGKKGGMSNKSKESKPKDSPKGTKPISEAGLTKEEVHRIKEGVGAGPKDWTGISPEGNIITSGPNGESVSHGPYTGYLP